MDRQNADRQADKPIALPLAAHARTRGNEEHTIMQEVNYFVSQISKSMYHS
jgi:hypothetical protein